MVAKRNLLGEALSVFFTFWSGLEAHEPEAVHAWRRSYPSFTLFGDADVLPLFDSDAQREIYKKIRIPACKSDVARLALLRHHGGLYVDAHTGPSSSERLAETLGDLARYELILFSKGWETNFNFMNGVLAARRRLPIFDRLLERAFDNLVAHKRREAETTGHVEYNIFRLTGTRVMLELMFDNVRRNWEMKPEFRENIHFHVMASDSSPGFQIYKYRYRKPGAHWSERQLTERLFED
ncbi:MULTISPECIES: glycosyltransferase [Methylosinus]|uniref:Uncharacterized protein n=1 Tax=Methylosinus trichosporium (strain ATCC 35070 / NCIMB 11131 / UNIQEM 75 / OB3b) TaxID=595536 RepID=A0A2D2D092_METT3|nr:MULTISPECIES: glycosyltransferase [Methylosinus]ATQ68411.1 hypothetical protein CQW49_11345 [Methylosinus trichosporium OB3b]OBS51351.1 hypothetical protein A8B73_16860 [Methylosinus sp. 3S-1]